MERSVFKHPLSAETQTQDTVSLFFFLFLGFSYCLRWFSFMFCDLYCLSLSVRYLSPSDSLRVRSVLMEMVALENVDFDEIRKQQVHSSSSSAASVDGVVSPSPFAFPSPSAAPVITSASASTSLGLAVDGPSDSASHFSSHSASELVREAIQFPQRFVMKPQREGGGMIMICCVLCSVVSFLFPNLSMD